MPLTSFSGRAATAVVAGKPERWVCCGPPQNLSGGDSIRYQGRFGRRACQGEPLLSPYVRLCISLGRGVWKAGGRRGVGEAAAAELSCPASLAELQLLTELLALLEPPPPSGPTAISVVPRLPGPQSYLTQSASCSESSAAPH